MVRLLVCGSRTLEDKQNYIESTLNKLVGHNHVDILICGMARGADIIAFHWAYGKGIKIVEYHADWKTHGKKAGSIRNQRMLDEGKPTHVIAFQDCRKDKDGSNGTNHMIRISKEKGLKVKVINITN